jgi:hypothetical protein
MKHNKKIIIGVITLGLVVVLAVFIYHSRQGLTQNKESATTDTTSSTTEDINFDEMLYGTATSTVLGMSDTDSNVLLKNDSVVPKYLDFLKNLQNTCPFYKPSGVAYRDCLAGLLVDREKAAEQIYSDLVRDTGIVGDEAVAEEPVGGGFTNEVNKYFLTNLAVLEKTWKPYRDALCGSELSDTYGGSNQYGYFTTCQLYETTAYEARLLGFRYDWVGWPVGWRVKQNVTIKLDSFKKLVQREQQMFGTTTP